MKKKLITNGKYQKTRLRERRGEFSEFFYIIIVLGEKQALF